MSDDEKRVAFKFAVVSFRFYMAGFTCYFSIISKAWNVTKNVSIT